ncbi:MAG: lysylphosphatidylglycerol synthase transmembrane domain-containing protein [bacterium]|nr:lysylphosphatidylglycerol synthase transmembrane domain-containing protein [bacterium]
MTKRLVVLSLKLSLLFAVIYYLVSTGRLEPRSVLLLAANPLESSSIVFFVFFGLIGLTGFRWWLLLRSNGFHLSLFRTEQILLIAHFFSTFLPGAAGIDVIKSGYLIKYRDAQISSKTPLLTTILLDRLLGVKAILILSCISLLSMHRTTFLESLFWLVLLIFLAMAFALVSFIKGFKIGEMGARKLSAFLKNQVPTKIVKALSFYETQKKVLFSALATSLLIQMINVLVFYLISRILPSFNADFFQLAALVPVGLLLTIIPLGPSGIGAGYIGFDYLFSQLGISGGAEAFNLYILTQLTINLLCAVAFLFPMPRAASEQ